MNFLSNWNVCRLLCPPSLWCSVPANFNAFGVFARETSILLFYWAALVKQLVLNHTKGQGHTWDLNSDLLMSPSVYAPWALVCLVPHLTPDSFSCLQPLPAAGDALCCLQHVPTGNVSPCRTFSQKAGGAHRCVWRKRPGHGLFSKSVALWAG